MIKSSIPPTTESILFDKPFEYTLSQEAFYIPPLSLEDYIRVESRIHTSLRSLLFQSTEWKELLEKELDHTVHGYEALEKMENLVDILFDVSIWVAGSPEREQELIKEHNQRIFVRRERRVHCLKEWFSQQLSLYDTIQLASYLMRYTSEFKKKLFLLLQKGIESATTYLLEHNPTSYASTDEDWKPGYLSLGQELLDMPLQ
jgi:hypothetical protein